MLHPSVRGDALAAARHRVFMAPRLLGSLAALAAFPVYLAIRGAPGVMEVMAFAWLIVPILLSYYLSRTGRYETAHMLSSLALVGLIVAIAIMTGGIESFAAMLLIVVPLEAALSSSRRSIVLASVLAGSAFVVLAGMTYFNLLPAFQAGAVARTVFAAFVIGAAIVYAVILAFGAQSIAGTSGTLLSVEEDRYHLLARNMSDVISRHRRDGSVEFVSAAAEALLGAPAATLIGHGLFDRVHVADRPAYLTALSDAARGGAACSVEFRIRCDDPADGREAATACFIWVEMRCRPLAQLSNDIETASGGVVAVMRDITERKAQEAALEQARMDAERADASKSRFLATMSHELRTPLNAIIGFSEMISQEDVLKLDAARRKEYAQLINDSGQHLLSVVNGILDMSKMEAGNFELSIEPFAPQPAILNCCSLLALKAREKGVDLVTATPDDLPQLNGDARAFKQILLNLISNAIKFTERGGAVTVAATVEQARLILRVSDTGVGIDADDLKRVGDPFFQAGATYQRRHEGTGLGLSIVKSLVALHGGEMSVHSRVAEGTTITIALPLLSSGTPRSDNVATLKPVPRQPTIVNQVRKSA